MWDAEKYEVRVLLRRNGEQIESMELQYAGKTSQFMGTCFVDEPGAYEATVYAYAPANGNTGLDRVTFIVAE